MFGDRRLLAGAGALALIVAALAAAAPWALPVSRAALGNVLSALAGTVGLGGLAVLACLLAAFQVLASSERPVAPPALPLADAAAASENAGPTTDDAAPREPGPESVPGAAFDEQLAAAGRIGDAAVGAEESVRADLRRLATDVYQQRARCDWETAARAVDEGRWTDDTGAAAFVGGPDAPTVPLDLWLRAVLSDEGAFHAQTTRTIRAIDELRERDPDDLPVGEAVTAP
jgi:hypothetical protein